MSVCLQMTVKVTSLNIKYIVFGRMKNSVFSNNVFVLSPGAGLELDSVWSGERPKSEAIETDQRCSVMS